MADPAGFPEVKMDFPIETNGPFQPTWSSIAANVRGNGTPAWLRQAKFGIWLHYGPQANLQNGDWTAQHMYQQGSESYKFDLSKFGHPTTNGYKDVIKRWSPTNYNPAGLAQLFYNAGARFVLVHKPKRTTNDITLLLRTASRNECSEREELFNRVYEELRRMAAHHMAGEAAGHTLQPTALVHEAWLQLVGSSDRTWENRAHFFGAATEAMRRILIDI
jgi:hypothetical protein